MSGVVFQSARQYPGNDNPHLVIRSFFDVSDQRRSSVLGKIVVRRGQEERPTFVGPPHTLPRQKSRVTKSRVLRTFNVILILFVIMSLFGAQSIFAAAASTEEALQRAKELNRERLPASGDTKTTASAESGPESPVEEDQQASSADVPGSPAWLQRLRGQTIVVDEVASPPSDPAARTSASSEFHPAQGQTIVVDDATSLSAAAPLAESVPMTFETWKGLFLQHVEETDLLVSGQLLFPKVLSYLAQLEQDFASEFAHDSTFIYVRRASKNFCENWAAVTFPDAAQIKDGVRPEGCWEQSEAGKAWLLTSSTAGDVVISEAVAVSFRTAALRKKEELSSLFPRVRDCASTYPERLAAILEREPMFTEECHKFFLDTEEMGTLFKSARDLLVGIVLDLRKFHSNKLRCADPFDPDALVREWKTAKARRASLQPSTQQPRATVTTVPDRHRILAEFSKSAKDLEHFSRTVEETLLHDTNRVWSSSFMEVSFSSNAGYRHDLGEDVWNDQFQGRMTTTAASLWELEELASEIGQALVRHRDEQELVGDDICGRIGDAGTRYQDLVREFRQVLSQDERPLVRTKNALEADLLLVRRSLARTWRKICETHKFPPLTRVPGQRDVASMIFSGDFPDAEAARNLHASAAAEQFQSVLDDVVPRLAALRQRFEKLIRSEGTSSGVQSSCPSDELDLPVLERETLLVATQLRKLECLSDSMDALRLNVIVTAPNGEILCDREATLYASSGTRLTIGALTITIRDDIEASLKNFVRIRDADPVEIGIQNVRKAIHAASLSFDSTYSGAPLVGRAGLLELGFLSRAPEVFENVVFAEAVTSDIGPGKLSLICQMYAFGTDGVHAVSSVLFFSEKDEQFYQLPLKCDNISLSSERTDTLLHTVSASSSLIGGRDRAATDSGEKDTSSSCSGGGVDAKESMAPTGGAFGSGPGISSGVFSRKPPKGSRAFGGFFGTSSLVPPTRFQFSDESSCAAAYAAVEAFHGKMRNVRRIKKRTEAGISVSAGMRHYLFEQVLPENDGVCSHSRKDDDTVWRISDRVKDDGGRVTVWASHQTLAHFERQEHECLNEASGQEPPEQLWDYPAIAAITRGRVTEAVIHHKMETSAELPKIGEFLKSFTTDTIDLQRIRIVPYGADDLFDDETAVLDVLRQQDRDDMEWTVRGGTSFSTLQN